MIPGASSHQEDEAFSQPNDSASAGTPRAIQAVVTPAVVLSAKFRIATFYSPANWRVHLERIADDLEKERDFQQILDRYRLPAELNSILMGSLSAADPAAFLIQVLRNRDSVRREWNGLLKSFIYPGCMIVLAGLIAWSICRLSYGILAEFENDRVFRDSFNPAFAMNQLLLADFSNSIVSMGLVLAWLAGTILAIRSIGPRWTWIALLTGLPFVGRPLRWIYLVDVLTPIRGFISEGRNPNEAAIATAKIFEATGLSPFVQSLATRLDAGIPMGRAIKESTLSDGLVGPAIGLLDSAQGNLPHRLDSVIQLLEQLIRQRCRGMVTVVSMLGVLFAGSIVWGTLSLFYASMFGLLNSIIRDVASIGNSKFIASEKMLFNSHWIALFPIGVCVWVGLRLAIAENPRFRSSLFCLAMRIAIFMMFALALMGIATRFQVLGLFWMLLAIFNLSILWIKRRELQRSAIAISLSAMTNPPEQWDELALAFEEQNFGFLKVRARRFRRYRAMGISWLEAFEKSGLVRGVTKRFSLRLLAKNPELPNMRQQATGESPRVIELDRLIWQMMVSSFWLIVIPVTLAVLAAYLVAYNIFPMFLGLLKELGELPKEKYPSAVWFLENADKYPIWILGLLVALVYFGLVWIYFFPNVTRRRPLEWFFRSYFRSAIIIALLAMSFFQVEAIMIEQTSSFEIESMDFAP